MLLRIPKVRHKEEDFDVIVAKIAVTRIIENISLEGLLLGVFPALSVTLYEVLLNISLSRDKSKHQGIFWGLITNREELISLIPDSDLSPGNILGQGCYYCKRIKSQTASPPEI